MRGREVEMKTDEEFVGAFMLVETFLRDARRDQVAEALRLLACEVAYCGRYRKRPSLDELAAQVSKAHRDQETMRVVVEGMRHLAELLARLRVPAPEGTPERKVEPMVVNVPETNDVNWFSAGWAVYIGAARGATDFPPMNDMEAQRWWLGGFGAAWAEDIDDRGLRAVLNDEGIVSESVDEALARALAGREALLRQLRSHRQGWGTRTLQ
jgi:hypothetical protein